ncbi:MAG: DUF1835 domain-containing protein [Flavisolibacter sp.]
MIHIVFQTADVDILNKVIELDQSLEGEILEIKEEFAVGPLDQIDTEEGWNERLSWWNGMIANTPYSKNTFDFDDRKTVEVLTQKLDENPTEEVWIWMGQNQHDVCGYYWLISQLAKYQGRVVVLYFNNLPFINEKGNIFYPTALHEIQPKEFLKAKKLNRKVTPSEFEVDPDEWKRLVTENSMIRILEGGKKIAGKEEDFYDKDVISGLTREWQKGNRAIHQILGKMKIKTGDVFLLWRIQKLVEQGKVEINGDPSKSWKDFELKLKSSQEIVTELNENG